MNVVGLDIPLLILGFGVLAWARLTQPRHVFQILLQGIATFQAQYSLFFTLSLGRTLPFLAMSAPRRTRGGPVRWLAPFALYAIALTLIVSQRWTIPPGVRPFYGEYRFAVQLLIFFAMCVCTLALSEALQRRGAMQLFFDLMTALVIIHGAMSLYQVAADELGLPLIGISRPHLEDLDVARFSVGGSTVLRPGGLAGEPKVVAVLFASYLLLRAFGAPRRLMTRRRRLLEQAAVVLSGFGLLMAFSTSSYVGLAIGLVALVARFPSAVTFATVRVVVVAIIAFMAWSAIYGDASAAGLLELIRIRSIDRLTTEQAIADPPIAASLMVLRDDPFVALFGTGLGGSSFVVMRYFEISDTSFAPSVGMLLLLVETGAVGAFLLLGAVFAMFVTRMPAPTSPVADASRMYLCFGIAVFAQQMSGHGIPLGYPLSLACLSAAAALARRGRFLEAT